MRLFFKIIILIGLFACPVFVQAQGELSLEQLERIVTVRELGAKQERIVDMIIEDNPAALEQELKNGFSANSYIWGNSLLGFAIDYQRWDMVMLLLKYGADIRAPFELGGSELSNLSFLHIALNSAQGRKWRDLHFYQCLSVVKHYGKNIQQSPRNWSVLRKDDQQLHAARYTWELVSQKNVPVVWAAAFTNNMDLLLSLDLKDADKPYTLTEELLDPSNELIFEVFPSMVLGQKTTPSYWVKHWGAVSAGQGIYAAEDYDKVLKSF